MTVWVVTGANRGLGLEFIRQLSIDSSNTIIATVRSTSKTDTSGLQALKSKNQQLHILSCDTSSTDAIAAFAKEVTQTLGKDAKIDFLLNNAGINTMPSQTALSINADILHSEMTTNVLGPAKITELLVHHLGKGSVVMNMTSGLGSVSEVIKRQLAMCASYSISKTAVNMLTAHQSVVLKEKGIVVVAMDPGWVKTDMGGESAVLEQEESISGMLKVLRKVGLEESGKYYEYNGNERSW